MARVVFWVRNIVIDNNCSLALVADLWLPRSKSSTRVVSIIPYLRIKRSLDVADESGDLSVIGVDSDMSYRCSW
jgi:hypothetical protein